MGRFMRVLKLFQILIDASALCLSLAAGSVFAWIFSMEGEYILRDWQVSQFGLRGFFGRYDLDNSSTGGNFASREIPIQLNRWGGVG
jgi:hypothetical protein